MCACLFSLSSTAGAVESNETPTTRPPNVVVIMAAELGYNDLSIQGSTAISTPRIDSIATDGIRFPAAYIASSFPGPAIAGFWTGRHPCRWGQESNGSGGLPAEEITLAEDLKKLGYATGQFGSWYLGGGGQHPLHQGFDESYSIKKYHTSCGIREESANQKDPRVKPLTFPPAYLPPKWNDDIASFRETADAVAFTCDFITRHKDQPFLAYCSIRVPSGHPDRILEKKGVSTAYRERAPKADSEIRRDTLTMLLVLDEVVGHILDTLDDHSIADNTMVVFLSNTGGAPRLGAAASDVSPFRATWCAYYEGSLRTPLLIRWPNGPIPAGTVYDKRISIMDLRPTIVTAAGGVLPEDKPCDGIDLMPFLTGKRDGVPHQRLFYRTQKNFAVIDGDWKLGYFPRLHKSESKFLYNFAEDIQEKNDLFSSNPEKADALMKLWEDWNAGMGKPWINPKKLKKAKEKAAKARK